MKGEVAILKPSNPMNEQKKDNELIELKKRIESLEKKVAELDKRTHGSAYVDPSPSPYDLSAFPRKKK